MCKSLITTTCSIKTKINCWPFKNIFYQFLSRHKQSGCRTSLRRNHPEQQEDQLRPQETLPNQVWDSAAAEMRRHLQSASAPEWPDCQGLALRHQNGLGPGPREALATATTTAEKQSSWSGPIARQVGEESKVTVPVGVRTKVFASMPDQCH